MAVRRQTLLALVSALVAAILLVAACGGGAAGPDPASGAIRRADVPAGWTRCPASGSLSRYLAQAQKHDASSAKSIQRSWNGLQKMGATRADVTEYAAERADCSMGLGKTAGASALTWTVAYKSSGDAHRAYQRGVLGFPTPDPARIQPGLQVGTSTGLGLDSWTLTQTSPRPPLFLAWWRHRSFTDFLVVLGLPATEAGPMALRVDAHMRR